MKKIRLIPLILYSLALVLIILNFFLRDLIIAVIQLISFTAAAILQIAHALKQKKNNK